jgi:phosphoribosylformylglycinamidine cyclo-ligase
MNEEHGFTYKDAGVDVAAGNEAVRLLKERLRSAQHPLVLEGIGGFGGVMRLPPVRDAVLVAGTDGVGTKVLIAKEMGRLDTVGIDLVAMSVNDVSAVGAVPLFFLDYLVIGKVEPDQIATLVAGVDEGCLRAGCVLLGGETAEHPGHFRDDSDFDMAGFAVGLATKDELWGPTNVREGDALIGIESTGLHSNGFSLVRALLREHGVGLGDRFPQAGHEERTVGDVLLTPTSIYSPVLHDLGHACTVHAAAHITGGGFPDNVGRAVPEGLGALIDLSAWRPLPVFPWLHGLGVSRDEMLRTFNCGLGMVVSLPGDQTPKALGVIERGGFAAQVVGKVVRRDGHDTVRYENELML